MNRINYGLIITIVACLLFWWCVLVLLSGCNNKTKTITIDYFYIVGNTADLEALNETD